MRTCGECLDRLTRSGFPALWSWRRHAKATKVASAMQRRVWVLRRSRESTRGVDSLTSCPVDDAEACSQTTDRTNCAIMLQAAR